MPLKSSQKCSKILQKSDPEAEAVAECFLEGIFFDFGALDSRELASRLSAVLKITYLLISQFSEKMLQTATKFNQNYFQNPSKMFSERGTENIPVFNHFLVAFGLPKWSQKYSKIGVKKHPGTQGAPRELPRVPQVSKRPPLGASGAPFWTILAPF